MYAMTNEELVAAIQNGESERILELWEQVSRFIHYQAYKRIMLLRHIGGVDIEDLCQSGYFALIEAVKTYRQIRDTETDVPFISWLALYLKQEFALACNYRTAAQRNDPMHRAASLDAPMRVTKGKDNNRGNTLAIFVADPENCIETLERQIYLEQLRAALEDALNSIPPEQAEVIREQYFRGRTLTEIGPHAKSRAIIAMRHLRHPLISAKLRKFLPEGASRDIRADFLAPSKETAIPTREELEKILQGGDD